MSDYMKEAERLIAAHESAIRQHDRGAEWDEGPAKTLSALLAHIQRGAVPEGWQVVPKKPTPEMLAGGWGYWLNVMAPGKQRDTAAKEYAGMLAAAPTPDQFRDAAKMMAVQPACMNCSGHGMVGGLLPSGGEYQADPCPDCTAPAPAAVPMPEPVVQNYPSGKWSYHADQMHAYGAAGEAAGYARGREEAGRDADRYQWLCSVATEQQWAELGGYTLTNTIDDYIDAAMRMEIKP